jgi:hypothetical protein
MPYRTPAPARTICCPALFPQQTVAAISRILAASARDDTTVGSHGLQKLKQVQGFLLDFSHRNIFLDFIVRCTMFEPSPA